MSRETTDNFWEVMRGFEWPESRPVEYRLYHDDQGQPLFYTMEALPGTYIAVDQLTYVHAPHNVVVQNGKLRVLAPSLQVWRLAPSADSGSGTACDPRDVCVVVGEDQPYQKWTKKSNDIS